MAKRVKSSIPTPATVTSPGAPALAPAPVVTDQANARKAKQPDCEAAEVGHHACQCGRDGCGDKVTG